MKRLIDIIIGDMMERVKTGIEGYDKLLHGGYVPNTVNLVSGCSGAGKTLFAISYIHNGAKEYGQKGVYITLEEMMDHLERDLKTVGLDFDDVDEELFQRYDLSGLRHNILSTEDDRSSPESPLLLSNLLEFIEINFSDADRLALDSVVPLNMVYDDLKEFRSELFRFTIGLKNLGFTSLLTTEVPYGSSDLSRFGLEDFLADSVTLLNIQEEWGRRVKVHKMRGSDHVKDYVDYDISASGVKVMA